jgi:glycosyltransferase involved in cell wall biosynthesis
VTPRVSVVMPAYQAAWSIGASISSILWQSYSDLELVIVDDGSTDATSQIASAFPGPIRVLRQPENLGVSAARNRGIAEAKGELIVFCDADDIWFGTYLETLVGAVDHGAEIVVANAWLLFPGGIDRQRLLFKGDFPRPQEQRRAILERNFAHNLAIFPRRLVDEIGGFPEDRRRGEEWDFWIRAIFAGHPIALQPKPLALCQWTSTSLSAEWQSTDADELEILGSVEGRIQLREDERDYLRRRLSSPAPRQLARKGDEALRDRRYREAARLFRQAGTLSPSDKMLVWKGRVVSIAPRLLGPLVRARQLRIESRIGFERRDVR